ncbi:tyrosine-protein phosphatase [Streptomyces sp. NPDC050095]|uniref:tyrosine-protein phosphatase n=1 Tax=unclassified Streptomyces TaxID=2593676 RepID=UPI0034430A7E
MGPSRSESALGRGSASRSSLPQREMMSASAYLNTRDIGGIRLPGGLHIAPGAVFRTAAEESVLPEVVLDLARDIEGERLADGGAGTPRHVHFLDLRSPSERNGRSPRTSRDTVRVHRLPLRDPDDRRVPPSDRGPEYFAEQYVRMLPAAGTVVARVLELVASDTGPVVVGCRLGKDRTGLVVLVLLSVLGASDRDNRAEFGRTGQALARRRDWLDRYAARRGETPADVLRRCHLPPGVPQHVLDVLHLRAAWNPAAPTSWPAIDATVLRRAHDRLTQPRGERT